jgi:hypothetical protein
MMITEPMSSNQRELDNTHSSKRHGHHSERIWELIIGEIDVFPKNTEHATQRLRIKYRHWRAEYVLEGVKMKMIASKVG